jgi:Zn-dependent M28 family amino/carboxypeptidase
MNARQAPFFFVLAAAGLVLWSCQGSRSRVEPVTVQEIETHIRNLSSDQFEGRAVGTKGIELAARYQEEYFRTFGLEPAFGTSYRQSFPIRGVKSDSQASMVITSPTVDIAPIIYDEFLVNSEREDSPAEAAGELVYCGFLIQAPERNWDDIKGTDLKGKVLLVEINEPGNRPGGPFDGEDMTYYGRWTYKFEKAAELGAAGVLIIHNTKGAAYGWDVLRNPWATESLFLPEKNPRLFFQGWVSGELADKVFRSVKLDHRALLAKAETADFAPVPLGLTVKVRQKPSFRMVDGFNVAGIVRAKHPEARKRMIVLSAHYDHFGKDESLEGDQIFNGAVDNCSASASLLALAGFYAQRPEKLKDDLCFVAVTGEERLFLGSDYFVRHLPFPASSAVADINFEMTNVWGETEDAFAIGAKHSELDEVCRQAAEKTGLRYIPERNGELGFFFRSDQISFVKAGIPGVWLSQGIVSRGPDKGLIQRKFDDYRKTKYHKVTDEIQPDWDLRGTLQIIRWAEEIIALLQEREALPQFLPTSSFKRQAASGPGGTPPVEK